MNINIDYQIETDFSFDEKELFKNIYEEIIRYEDVYNDLVDAEISVVFCDEEHIRQVNKQYRDIDKSTDVLSFPMIDTYGPCEFELELFEDEELILGDIVICVPKAISQANEYGHSLKREISFLFTHGILHLLGYDHIDEDDRIQMEYTQNKILMALNITR